MIEGKGEAALLSLYNELYDEIARLEWKASLEPLRPRAPPPVANLT